MDNNQYFITKIKDEYLPQVMKDNISNGRIRRYTYFTIFYIDKKYLRKIKIKNIENSLDEEEKALLDFLLNENFTDMLTMTEFEEKTKNGSWGGTSYSSGMSGSSATSGSFGSGSVGCSGVYGVTGYSST